MASREATGQDKGPGYDGPTKRQDTQRFVPAGNGEQRGFSTGATRSTDAGKIDFEGHISPDVLLVFGEYMHRHRIQRDGNVRDSDNWQKGIPVAAYVKSLIRHTIEFWRMWRGATVINPDNQQPFTLDEVLSAILFNVMGIIFEMQRSENLQQSYTFVTPEMRQELEAQLGRKS